MAESKSVRTRVRAMYMEAKAKKGFKGYWQMQYLLHDVICVENDSLVCASALINDVACIKGKNFKRGDILEFNVTVTEKPRGGYKISRPTSLECVGHEETL